MAKLGDKENIIIQLQNGMKIKAVAVISELVKHGDNIIGISYTVPNMHFNVQGNKLVKSIDVKEGDTAEGNLFSGEWIVHDPLINLEQSRR
jgi:hypothetical protein